MKLSHVALMTALLSSQPTWAAKTPANATKTQKGEKAQLPNVQINNDGMTLMYGNSLIERLQEEGTFEALMQASTPNKKVQYRSMAYMGDQVDFRIRASRFGTHLDYLVKQWPADRIIMAFGGNEAYDGAEGLDEFKAQLTSYIELIKKRHPKSEYIIVSPTAAEKVSSLMLPDINDRNNLLEQYSAVMSSVAKEKGVTFVDLFQPTKQLFQGTDKKYTSDGFALTPAGASKVGQILASKLSEQPDSLDQLTTQKGFASLKKLVSRKAREIAQAYHPQNGISYYGIRARTYEYLPEIPHYLKLGNTLDQSIWKQAANLTKAQPMPELEVLRIDVPDKKPKRGLGTIKSSNEDLKDFTLADGFEVNCYASSEDYPELINPLQINFDTHGRLWVTCFASYPHPLPGELPKGKILIFEDTNGDGKADKKSIFADGLDLPDGFTFYKNGIIASVSRKIIYLEDSTGDNKADYMEEIVRGLDNTDTHHGGYLSRTPQGDLLISEALFHRGQFETPHGVFHTIDTAVVSYDLDTRKMTTERLSADPNPWKITFNKWGESMHYFGGGQLQDADIYNIWIPMASTAPTSLGMPFRYDKGCGAQYVESPHFPKEWQNGLLTTHLLNTNEVNYTPLKLVNGTYKAANKKTTLIASNNKVFRPTDLAFGFDGALYISDFYYPIIGHAQHSVRDKQRDYANGRIWRVTHKKSPLVTPVVIDGQSPDKLIELLAHPHLKIRQTARVELEKHDDDSILKAIARHKAAIESNEELALEVLWLYERMKHFQDTSLIKKLVNSDNINVARAATRSLRWWNDALGSEAISIATKLASHPDDRLKIALVSVSSHLQLTDGKWTNIINSIQDTSSKQLTTVKKMAGWKDRPGLAPEFPLLDIAKDSFIAKNQWLKSKSAKSGTVYFKSETKGELVIGHDNNPGMNLTTNDTPLVIATGSPHTKDSQNTFKVQKGLNKIEYTITKAPRASASANIYLCDKSGNKPNSISYASNAKEQEVWAQEFEKQQSANWKQFATRTFQANCANCHAIDTKAVGPALRGLLGKKQTVILADGSKKEVTIDHDYLVTAIKKPMSMYPEGFAPAMPPMQLSDKEVDMLVKWLESLK
ncbi:GDSL-type esterase/lipase family protein [Rubritalea spongiae]|uniref:GDSL-type esterase/lipase family protein n=1 Tax=Rubritalea spongiae TaxID=430797 RepID=A0ABW5E2G4_9BACT